MFFLVTSLTASLGLADVALRIDVARSKAREASTAQSIQELEENLVRLRAERRRAEADADLWKHIESLGFRRDLKPSRDLAKELREGKPGVQTEAGGAARERQW